VNILEVKIRLLSKEAKVPKYQTECSAGFDLSSVEDIEIDSGEVILVSTGLAFELPNGFELQLRPRSGLALKHGITLLNSPATIDSDYRGEIKVILINHGKESFKISVGDRIAQGVISKVEKAEFQKVSLLSESDRGDSGFGSTGKR
jgi:dUTP pyrophosphatase